MHWPNEGRPVSLVGLVRRPDRFLGAQCSSHRDYSIVLMHVRCYSDPEAFEVPYYSMLFVASCGISRLGFRD